MSSEKWTEDQVIAAFGKFRNPESVITDEDAESRLRKLLKSLGKDKFEASDIHLITEQITPCRCANSLAIRIISTLNENTQE